MNRTERLPDPDLAGHLNPTGEGNPKASSLRPECDWPGARASRPPNHFALIGSARADPAIALPKRLTSEPIRSILLQCSPKEVTLPAKQDYAVGRGKPPIHTQFRKGQSGNPSGKPGPARSLQKRLRAAVEEALDKKIWDLKKDIPMNALDAFAQQLVLRAMDGESPSLRAFLNLIGDANETAVLAPPAGEPVSLPQGKTQGSFETAPAAAPETVVAQDVASLPAEDAGTIAAKADEDTVPPRPKRPTIIIAGETVQQGD
jgi:uncharacterized protein DUF5681